MSTRSKMFWGILAALFVASVAGWGYSYLLHQKVQDATAACESEAQKDAPPSSRWRLECNPENLGDSRELIGVQHALADAYEKHRAMKSLGRMAGFFALISGLVLVARLVLPALWYFLLRRIRELSAAVRGD